MSRLFQLVHEVEPCDQRAFCRNSPDHSGHPRCAECDLSPGGGGKAFWWPVEATRKHPVLEQRKRDEKFRKSVAKTEVRKNRDRGRMAVQSAAQRAEKTTERNIIAATVNSGRRNNDADHRHFGKITLDTKLQSGNVHPVVRLQELDKVRQDAIRAGSLLGALVIRTKHGRGVVAMDEEDYARLVNGMEEE